MNPICSELTNKITEIFKKVKQTELGRKLKVRGLISDPIGKTQEEYQARAKASMGQENAPYLSREQQRTERIERERKRIGIEGEIPTPDEPPDPTKPPNADKHEKWDSLAEMRENVKKGNAELAKSNFNQRIGRKMDRADAKRQT